MTSPSTSKQPTYDEYLNGLEYLRAFKTKLDEFYQSLDNEKEATIKNELSSKLTDLSFYIQTLEGKINQHKDALNSNSSLSDIDKQDLKLNLDTLSERQKKYQELYKNAPLINKDGKNWLAIDKWKLLTDSSLPPFIPLMTRVKYTHVVNSTLDGDVTKITLNQRVNYRLSTRFVYADDQSEVLSNRYVWYWNQQASTTQSSDIEWAPQDPQFAFTNSFGQPSTISLDDSLKIEIENGVHRAHLIKPIRSSLLNFNSDQSLYATYHLLSSEINLTANAGFFAYPLDAFPFLSKSTSEITQIPINRDEKNPDLDLNNSVVSHGMDIEEIEKYIGKSRDIVNKGDIAVHCTLPEWNHRLRSALMSVQQQIKEYNLLLSALYIRIKAIDDMLDLLQVQTEYPYKDSEKYGLDINTIMKVTKLGTQVIASGPAFWLNEDKPRIDAEKSREELLQNLVSLKKVMTEYISYPEKAPINIIGYVELATQKKQIENSSQKLWELFNSTALMAELERYIECTVQALNDDEKSDKLQELDVFPGPYMEEEGNWSLIFNTIAESIAALSSSDLYRTKVYEKIRYSIFERFINLDINNKVHKDLLDVWNEEALSHYINELDKVKEPKNSYIFKQAEDTNVENANVEYVKSVDFGMLDIIFNDKTLITMEKLWSLKGYVVAGPGAPCVLQVILSCFQPEITGEIKDLIKGSSSYHLRFFSAIMRVFRVKNIVNYYDSTSNIKDIFKSFIVTSDTQATRKRSNKSRELIKQYAKGISDGSAGFSELFYDQYVDGRNSKYDVFAYAKVFTLYYDFFFQIQTALCLSDKAREEGWSDERLQLEYVKSSLDINSDILASAKGSLVIIERLKLANFKPGPTQGVDVIKSIGSKLDILVGFSSVIGLIITAENIKNMGPTTTDAEIIATVASFMSDLLIVSGWILGSELVGLALLGGVLTLVGSAIAIFNILSIIKDLLESIFRTGNQKYLLSQWHQFKSKLDAAVVDNLVEQSGINVAKRSRIDGEIRELETEYDQDRENIIKSVISNPYLSLTMNESTDRYIRKIDALLNKDWNDIFSDLGWLISDASYVELGNLSWRAIIPLYIKGYKIEDIEKLVKFEPSVDDFDGIKSVQDIIKYYKQLKEIDYSSGVNNEFYIQMPDENGNNTKVKIYELLEHGVFTPPVKTEQGFYLDNIWQHDSYRIPKLVK